MEEHHTSALSMALDPGHVEDEDAEGDTVVDQGKETRRDVLPLPEGRVSMVLKKGENIQRDRHRHIHIGVGALDITDAAVEGEEDIAMDLLVLMVMGHTVMDLMDIEAPTDRLRLHPSVAKECLI